MRPKGDVAVARHRCRAILDIACAHASRSAIVASADAIVARDKIAEGRGPHGAPAHTAPAERVADKPHQDATDELWAAPPSASSRPWSSPMPG